MNYGFKIINCVAAPRQRVAETYFLDVSDGSRYFCKIVDNKFFIPRIIRSLPVIEEIYKNGTNRINYPIRTALSALSFFEDEKLVILYNYIPAEQSYEYDQNAFGKLLGSIHEIKVTPNTPKEDFVFASKFEFEKNLKDTLNYNGRDEVTLSLKKVLFNHEKAINSFYTRFTELGELSSKKTHNMVVTHADASGNVLMKSPTDLYLIDWDEILLAPAERDVWMIDHDKASMEGYLSINPDYLEDNDLRSYYVLWYYFRCLIIYFDNILGDKSLKYRNEQLISLGDDLLTSWMIPKLNQIL